MTFFPHSSRCVLLLHGEIWSEYLNTRFSTTGTLPFPFPCSLKMQQQRTNTPENNSQKAQKWIKFRIQTFALSPISNHISTRFAASFFSNVIRNVGAWQRIKHVNQTLSVCALECCACTHRFHEMSRFALALSLSIGFAILFIYRHHDGPSC